MKSQTNLKEVELNPNGVHDCFFHLLFLESVNYILSKKLENKQKQSELEEMGCRIGERISNHLLNINNSRVKDIDEIIIFLGKDVWNFIFGRKISKLQTNRKGTYLIDSDDFKFLNGVFTEKHMTPETQQNIELILAIVSGVVKGTLSAFNIECIVSASFKPQPVISNLLGNMITPNTTISSYSFTINLLNLPN